MKTISELRKEYPNLSLKKICETLGLCYQYVLKASKQPKAGEVYDPINGFNDEAVNAIIERKGVNLESTVVDGESTPIDWDAIAAECAAARSSRGSSALTMDSFIPGILFTLRNTGDDVTYEVIYKSETHIVFIAKVSLTSSNLENYEELINTPRVMNFSTFLHQTPRIITKEEQA